MKNEDKKFIIDQLRKDKIIYAIEAVAVNTACILIAFVELAFGSFVGEPMYWIMIITVLVGVGYSIYMGITNFMRLVKIRRIEKELDLSISRLGR